ncbi:hypothetical protein AVEN_244181-1 [Araneus ventricosus]|uniref:Uncharacterized protein n=1 Tax=Araneus ventricosus TaxID=182803 RepID=A0A4Y2GEC1_ARAVE|nr:hypothetical protein AVEN_244181-1 [Araneus ventricosus]
MHLGHLNDSRYYSSSTEAAVLQAHHRDKAQPLPKEARTITDGGTENPTITILPEEASSLLLIRRQLISVLTVLPWRNLRNYKETEL